jgi:hypothetical protein
VAFALECVERCVEAFGSVMASMVAMVALAVVVVVMVFVVDVVMVLEIGDSTSVGVLEARRCGSTRG